MFYCSARIQENILKCFIIGLMLQFKTIYPNETSLYFSDKSIYYLMVEKMLLLWLNSKACGEHFTIWLWWATVRSFSHIFSLPYFPSKRFSTFYFLPCARCFLCCCGWITKLEGSISLPYLIDNRQICYSYVSTLIFGWMERIPFLKGNGIHKKPIIIYIDFQVAISKWCIVNAPKSLKPIDFWNSLELSSWIFKKTCLSFSIFYKLSFDFAFPASVCWYRWREDLIWSCKDFETGKLCDVFNVECFNHK